MNRLKEITRFVINGGISFVVDYGLLIFLTEYAGIYYLISAGISFTVSVAVNYIICVFWVFEGAKNNSGSTKIIFIGSSIVGLILNHYIMKFSSDIIGIDYRISKIAATLIVMFWNYVMKRRAIKKSV